MKRSFLIPILLVVFCLVTPLTLSLPFGPNEPDAERIVGGSTAPDGAYPYMVSLQKFGVLAWAHYCGGAIIAPQWIVSSASCFTDGLGLLPRALVGTNSLLAGGTPYGIVKVITLPLYEPGTLWGNIALVQVESNITFTSTVKPISVANGIVPVGVSANLTGWGFTLPTDIIQPAGLQQISLTTITEQQCYDGLTGGQYSIRSPVVCTQAPSGKGACQYDQGSPLVIGGKLVGVFSWGASPCAQGKPDLYASAVAFRGWIQNATGVIL